MRNVLSYDNRTLRLHTKRGALFMEMNRQKIARLPRREESCFDNLRLEY